MEVCGRDCGGCMTNEKDLNDNMKDLKDSLLVMALGIPFQAYVTSTIWGWFMVPLGVPAIGLWHAAGLGILVHVIRGKGGQKPPKDKIWTIFWRYVPFTLFMWGIAALAHYGMGL